jgi:hypothetical protein
VPPTSRTKTSRAASYRTDKRLPTNAQHICREQCATAELLCGKRSQPVSAWQAELDAGSCCCRCGFPEADPI